MRVKNHQTPPTMRPDSELAKTKQTRDACEDKCAVIIFDKQSVQICGRSDRQDGSSSIPSFFWCIAIWKTGSTTSSPPPSTLSPLLADSTHNREQRSEKPCDFSHLPNDLHCITLPPHTQSSSAAALCRSL